MWKTWKAGDVQDEANERLGRGLHSYGQAVTDRATENAPWKTGNLRRSGRVEPFVGVHEESGKIYVLVVFGGTKQGMMAGDVGYARFVELGTQRMTARPYLMTAMQQLAPHAKGIIGSAA